MVIVFREEPLPLWFKMVMVFMVGIMLLMIIIVTPAQLAKKMQERYEKCIINYKIFPPNNSSGQLKQQDLNRLCELEVQTI